MKSDLVTIARVVDGFATVGVVDYLAAPTVVESIERRAECIDVSLKASGLLLGCIEPDPVGVTCGGRSLLEVNDNPAPGEYSCQDGLFKINAEETLVCIRR